MSNAATASTRHPGGRPSGYSLELAAKLCELVGDGMSLHQACQGKGMPHPVTIYRWLTKHPEFRIAYQCALLAKFDEKAEELIAIADAKIDESVDQELMIRTRKWIMAKELPRKYGEMAPIPPAPPVEPMRPIEEPKTTDAKPNFVRALRTRLRPWHRK